MLEVFGGEGGDERRVLEDLLPVDDLGFHSGVLVVFGDPMGDAFAKG